MTRFEAFVARKTAEADLATIAPLVTDRDRGDDSLIAIGNSWSRALFDGLVSAVGGAGAPV